MKRIISVMLTSLLLYSVLVLPASAASRPTVAKGIDISYWQGTSIDWNKVKAAGYSFVIMRVGYSEKKDTVFDTNYNNAKAAGMHIGCYMYSYAVTTAESARDARDVVSWLQGKQLDYPVFYDMEDEKYQGSLTTKQRTDIALTFVKGMQQAGFYSGVYANKNWFTNYLNLADIQAVCDTWIAHYTTGVDYSAAHTMWQNTDAGAVSGIGGSVDLNFCYVDYPSIIKNGGYNGFEKPITYIPASGVSGDINGDGVRSLKDVTLLAQFVAGWGGLTVVREELNADKSKDGQTTLADVTYLAQCVAGWYGA